MKKLKDNARSAKIDDCAWLPSDKVEYFITKYGISDEASIDLTKETKEEVVEEKEAEPIETPLVTGFKEVKEQKAKKRKTVSKPSEEEIPEVKEEEPVKVEKS